MSYHKQVKLKDVGLVDYQFKVHCVVFNTLIISSSYTINCQASGLYIFVYS